MPWSTRLARVRRIAGRVALPGLLLLALALRLYRLGAANLWWDEALAVWAIRKGFVGATLWTASDVHPPLFFWALWAWSQLFGESELALRLLPALLGVLTVAAAYALGHVVGGRRTAILAAALTALSRFAVWWSQELRMYVLAGLLGTVSLWLFLRWLDAMREDAPAAHTTWLLPLQALATLGALYTIFMSGVWVLVENVVVAGLLIWGRGYRRRTILVRWALAQLAIAGVLAIWLALSWGRMNTWSVSEPVSLWFVLRLYATLLTTGVSVDIAGAAWLTILPLATACAGTILLVRRAVRERDGQGALSLAVLGLCVAVPPLLVYLSTLPRSLFYTPHIEARYLLPFATAFWVLLAHGASEIQRRWRRIGAALIVGLLATWMAVLPGYYVGRYLQDDYQTMSRAIVSQAEPGDVVLLDSGSRYPLFLYQYERLTADGRPAFETVTQAGELVTGEEIAAWIENSLPAYNRVWLAEVDVNLADPDRLLRSALAGRLETVWSEGYGANALLLFGRTSGGPTLSASYQPDHGSQNATATGLRGWEAPVGTASPAAPLWITLYWDTAPAEGCSLQLVNAQDQAVISRQVGLGEGSFRERVEIAITDALAPGRLAVTLRCGAAVPLVLTTVTIHGTADYAAPSGPAIGTEARFGQAMVLRGYTVRGAREGVVKAKAGEELVLDLYLTAERAPEHDWTVFTHLAGTAYNPATAGPLWGQLDAPPGGLSWPTSLWRAGDTVVARYVIPIDAEAPPGDYTLTFGLYDGSTGERAVVSEENGGATDEFQAVVTVRVEGD